MVLVGYFVYNGSWQAPAVLEVKGSISSLPAGFDVAWDSGSGFNRYEVYKVRLETPVNSSKPTQDITISLLKGSYATINEVLADGHKVNDSPITLNDKQPTVTFSISAQRHVSIRLLTDNFSGAVSMDVNGVTLQRDLYVANVEAKTKTYNFWLVNENHEFSVRAVLPRYHMDNLALVKRRDGKSIKLDSVTLHTNEKSVTLLDKPQYLTKMAFSDISDYSKRYFEWTRFIQQVLFAILTTWVLSALVRLYFKCGGVKGVLFGRQRTFVVFFSGAFICYLIWLLIFWPGVLSVDSLKIWRAAQLPEVSLNDHPVLNVFFYSYLYHIWNSTVIVPIVHIILMSALVAWIFYTVYMHGVSFIVILAFYLFTIFSIPIGLYNLMLWKDVPFAMLILFWAFMSSLMYLKQRSGQSNYTIEQIIALVLMLLAVGFVRHNGLLYVFFIPILLLILGVIKLSRNLWLGLAGLALLSMLALVMITMTNMGNASYLLTQGSVYFNGLLQSNPSELLLRTWNNYWVMLDINQTRTKWDLFHRFLHDRYSYTFLQHAGWHDVYPFQQRWSGPLAFLRDHALALYQASYTRPWVYLSWNPVWALVLFPISLILFRWLSLSAIFSSVILVQVVALAGLLSVMNWRYYYFVCLAACFIVPMICFDIKRMRTGQT